MGGEHAKCTTMEANKHRALFSQRLRGLMNRRLPDRMKHAELAQLLTEAFPQVMSILGHAHLDITMSRYAHGTDEGLRHAADALEQWRAQ